MSQILINVFIIAFIYVLPIVVFIKYLSRTGSKIYVQFLCIIIYAVGVVITSNFLDDLFPFVFAVLSILILKNNIYEDDYNKYNFSLKKIQIVKSVQYFVIFYIINIAVAIIFEWIFLKFNIGVKQQEIVQDMEKMKLIDFLKYIPVSVIFAPVLEEFIFRFVLFEKIFKDKIGLYGGCIVTSILFAILHYNIKAFPVLFLLAIENCYLIHKKGFWYSVLNHSLFNFITVAGIFFDKVKL